ncbi:MAG: TIGR03943 family protein [Verrucomicrobiae bacterium]|nr:TIGR03943 family protein [Verrucomicrobiae bacterium]
MSQPLPLGKVLAAALPLLSLSVWALLLIYFYVTPSLSGLIHPDYRIYTFLSGCLLMASLFFRLLELFIHGPSALICDDLCRGSQEFNLGQALGHAFLILPALFCFLIDTDSFSAQFVRNRGVGSLPPPAAAAGGSEPGQTMTAEEIQSVLAPGQVYESDVVELLLVASEPVARKELAGQRVSVTAQAVYQDSPGVARDPKRFYGVRLYITCCAADARPVGLLMHSATDPHLKEMAWYTFTGVLVFRDVNGRFVPEINVTNIAPAPAPPDSYLY